MKIRLFILSFLLLSIGSCNKGEETKTVTQSPSPSTPDLKPPTKTEGKEAPSTVLKQKARATVESGEPYVGKTAEITLETNEKGTVKGTFKLAENRLTLTGTQKKQELRLWVMGKHDQTSAFHRGYLFGTNDTGKLSGTFAISGNAGSPAIKGTWQTLD